MTQAQKTLLPTSAKIEIPNYPYGFRLKTTKFDSIEFNKSHGFRYVSQTINPKTGRENKPKKSTYYPIACLYRNEENGHIDFYALSPNGHKSLNEAIEFMQVNFSLFTPEQIGRAHV